MLRKPILAVLCLLLWGPAWSALAGFDPTLAVYWPLDEGQGRVAYDATGNSINGTISTGPTWVTPGKIGGAALNFTGTGDVRGPHVPMDQRSFTIAMWVNPRLPASGSQILFSERSSNANSVSMHLRLGGPASTDSPTNGIRFGFYNDDLNTSNNVIQSDTWYHLTFWYDWASKGRRIYINGAQAASGTSTTGFLATSGEICLGSWMGGNSFTGMVDDFQIYQKALTDAEILKIMEGLATKSLAKDPNPEDTAVDVPRNASLSWMVGQYASTHDVYFGTAFPDVNDASRAKPAGLLVSQGQTATTYDPAGLFAYGQTYYWRVDEVNAAPDNTIFKGGVWSFTAEPYGYPIKPVAATASSYQASMGPEKTIDGSGLSASDQHGTEPTTMWMSAGVPPNWIQYEFDKVYKLHQLLVWNSNQLIESFLGFGAKKVTIETSLDGTTWTPVANVPEFTKAPGAPGYAPNTTISLAGVEAKYVKLTINATWGGVAPQTGLAEVRFSYVPVQARAPQPANAATGVSLDVDLDWRPGREAASHNVFFGTDPNALATAKTVTDHSYAPGALEFGTAYYWKVDEVNAVTYPGEVWSFTTKEYAVVDDFESYTDDEGSRIYEAWIDGWTNGTGSQVGNLQAPFAERTIVHAGKQSMPFEYNNVKTPFYSEAERTFATPEDWTTNGATHLSLWLYGYPVSFLETPTGEITLSAAGADIYNVTDQFRYAYKPLNGNGSITVRVDSVDNINTWTKAGVMIRESLDPSVKSVHMIVTPSGRVEFQHRDTAGANTVQPALPVDSITLPYWVRLTRTGNTFTGEYSADGKTWQQLTVAAGTSTASVLMFNNVYIGLAVTSHTANVMAVARFSNVTTTGGVSGPWQVADIGVAHGGSAPGDVYVSIKDNAGKVATVTYPGGANVNGWTEWKIPLSDLTSAGGKMTSVKKIAIGVGDPASPKAGGAGKLFLDDIGFGRPVQ